MFKTSTGLMIFTCETLNIPYQYIDDENIKLVFEIDEGHKDEIETHLMRLINGNYFSVKSTWDTEDKLTLFFNLWGIEIIMKKHGYIIGKQPKSYKVGNKKITTTDTADTWVTQCLLSDKDPLVFVDHNIRRIYSPNQVCKELDIELLYPEINIF